MSNNGGDSDNAAIMLALIFIGLPMLSVLWLSNTIGASFFTTLTAIGWSLPGLLVVGVGRYCLGSRFSFWSYLLLAIVLVWPAWFPVLDSIGAGGASQSEIEHFFPNRPGYTTGLFKWGSEFLAVIGLSFSSYRDLKNDY